MKRFFRQSLITFVAILLATSLLSVDATYAQRRGGGSRGGGSSYRGGGGASSRVNSSVNLQNRGNFNGSRSSERSINSQTRQGNQQTRQGNIQQNQQTRQGNIQQNQQTRQGTQQERQTERTERTNTRQQQQTERTNTRQEQSTNRQQNRQDFIDDNYYRGGWYGGGYYVPAAWGWAGLATGLAIGASVASPPPYYDTVYLGSTSYIYSDGIYFEPTGSSYVVVAPPTGAVVSYLPEGCSQTQVNNTVYYSCSDIYYEPFYQNGSTVYRVVKL
ncbi:DUF6515 family protein [Crocosphaera sp. UHCC 0190]|uniref:DUF6515 family protein n=1 Tax=Crocosphaera sp. UHCC 0190 TaxID=3110246 RepID=UPI002B1F9D76|nr:DUF6515 family protein [Crocosphaera sp. UHCC 0190]MEA5509748.1 DUF6515 family protein [Crocosphaera sp. UHCC 0190]